ncbi:MAG TPA: hypothetical protein VMH87_02510 [Pseudomonadales bacterium]|nr:hypothetical protein [Pseudomonadales bacterium]
MRRLCLMLFLPIVFLLGVATHLRADSTTNLQTGRILKVLPFLVDTNGAVALSPSLFDRDAYQFYLLEHTNDVSSMRFDVQWKAKHVEGLTLKLRLELRGVTRGGMPTAKTLEQNVESKIFHHWTTLTLSGADYKSFGVLSAWRATLWDGDQLLGEQKSFLWSPPGNTTP